MLVLVATPVLVLGMVSPFAIRLALEEVDDAGQDDGPALRDLDLGSLAGTFLSALLLIPLVGTRRTFLAFAVALAIVGPGDREGALARSCPPLSRALLLPAGT